MRKLLCLATVLVLCMSLILPAFATEAEDDFVPSITYKPAPQIVPVTDDAGNSFIAVFRDAEGNITSYVEEGCLDLTPIAHLWDEDEEVPQVDRDRLQYVFSGKNTGDLVIP